MKAIAPGTLLAIGLSQALPLRTGNTWTWSVRTSGSDTTTNWITATVLRSGKHDSGTAWTIAVRDSANRSTDTAIAVERPDKSQAWLKGPSKLGLELAPWNGAKFEERNLTTLLAPWGLQSLQSDFWNRARDFNYTLKPEAGGPSNGSIEFFYFEGGSTAPVPRGVWIDTVGPVASRSFGSGWKEYRMLSHNRRAIDQTPFVPQERRPKTGTLLEWEEVRQSGWGYPIAANLDRIVFHRWTFLEPAPDSLGWTRWRVRDSSVDDSGRVEDSIHVLRSSRQGWTSTARRGGCPTPDDAWFADWTDSVGAEGILRRWRSGSVSTGAGVRTSNREIFERIGPHGQMDSASCLEQNYQVSLFSSLVTRTLIALDGVRIRSPRITAGAFPSPRKPSLALTDLRAHHPRLVLRWTDARGANGTLRAGDVSALSRFCPKEPVFLSATLPDGTAWKASILVR